MFVPGAQDICCPEKLPFVPKCAFAVDVSDIKRMGSALQVFNAAEAKAALDHHGTNSGFGDIWYVEGDRASTGELAMELIKIMGVEPDKTIADCVFVALCTDSGNFNYSNTDQRAYAMAGECVKYGVDVEYLTRKSFRERSLAAAKLLGDALSRINTACEGKIAYSYVDNAMLVKAGAKLEDANRICNYLNEITGVKIGVYFEQRGENTKVSWRAACGIDVAAIAGIFSGGGHSAAAGATVFAGMDEAIPQVIKVTEEALKGFEATC
jgi:phosphoesterase RecJ-like protein